MLIKIKQKNVNHFQNPIYQIYFKIQYHIKQTFIIYKINVN